MEKCKSFPEYSPSCSYAKARFGLEERPKSYSFNGPDGGKVDGNPEVERRRRVAAYNMYTVEGKVKSSVVNSFKWIKSKFTDEFYDA